VAGNTDIQNLLNIYNLSEEIENQKRNWYEHILRMDENRLPKIPLKYKPEGHTGTGKPKTKWKDEFN
jgi:hypothetical protein